MKFTKTKNWIFSGQFLYNRQLAIVLWFGLPLIAVLIEVINHRLNNFIIFRHVYIHTLQQVNLYLEYPQQYADVNLYGPFFSVAIAAFAVLPQGLGAILWVMANTLILYIAIRKLPVAEHLQNTVLVLCSQEMMNAASWLQSNALIAACIILGFINIWNSKDKWGLFFILIATFIKIYGIVGFAFFFFSKNKINFIKWAIIWSVVFFTAPMLFSSPSYIIQSYKDWYEGLQIKAAKNIRLDTPNDFQDISVMGMIRRILGLTQLKDIAVIIPAILIFALQYLRYQYFTDLRYGLYLLCSVLIFTVIFSTGSESPTYIIAFTAICTWYILQQHTKKVNALFIFALLVTSFSYSDLLTPWFREHIARPYSIKALPGFIIWLIIVWQILTKQFLSVEKHRLLLQKANT